jgi:hypothetical protein
MKLADTYRRQPFSDTTLRRSPGPFCPKALETPASRLRPAFPSLIGHRFLVGVEGFLYPVPMLPLYLFAVTLLAAKVYGPGSRCRFADRHIYFLLFCFLLLTESKYLTASSVVRMIGCRPISIRVTLFVCIPNASANTLCVMPSRSLARFSSSLVMALHYVVLFSEEVNSLSLFFSFRFGQSVPLFRSRYASISRR